ncbi:hypothetical protein QR685DRAFT_510285, partial [Neurospora intermedia]
MGKRAAGSAAAEPKPGANPGGVEPFPRPQPGPSYQPPHTDWIAVLSQKFLPSSKLRLPFFFPTRKSGASVACATSVFRRRHRCFRLHSTASAGIFLEWLMAASLVDLHGVIFFTHPKVITLAHSYFLFYYYVMRRYSHCLTLLRVGMNTKQNL